MSQALEVRDYKYSLRVGCYHFRGISEAERALGLKRNFLRARFHRANGSKTAQQVLDEVCQEMLHAEVFYLKGKPYSTSRISLRGEYISHKDLASVLGVSDRTLITKIRQYGGVRVTVEQLSTKPIFTFSDGTKTQDIARFTKSEGVDYWLFKDCLDEGLYWRFALIKIRRGEVFYMYRNKKYSRLDDVITAIGCGKSTWRIRYRLFGSAREAVRSFETNTEFPDEAFVELSVAEYEEDICGVENREAPGQDLQPMQLFGYKK